MLLGCSYIQNRSLSTKSILYSVASSASKEDEHCVHSSSGLSHTSSDRPHVLPRACISYCTTKYVRDSSRNSGPEGQAGCQLVKGGQLLEAAELKQDQNLLSQIENQDCVTIQCNTIQAAQN